MSRAIAGGASGRIHVSVRAKTSIWCGVLQKPRNTAPQAYARCRVGKCRLSINYYCHRTDWHLSPIWRHRVDCQSVSLSPNWLRYLICWWVFYTYLMVSFARIFAHSLRPPHHHLNSSPSQSVVVWWSEWVDYWLWWWWVEVVVVVVVWVSWLLIVMVMSWGGRVVVWVSWLLIVMVMSWAGGVVVWVSWLPSQLCVVDVAEPVAGASWGLCE